MFTKRDLLRSAALAAVTAPTAKSVPAYAQASADRPGFFKAKDIAEAGFIYGLPIVMNYAVMLEYAIDRNSGQFKAPFNQIKNEPNVFTYKDTAIVTPNSDTPYSFVWMDLRAEPVVISVPAIDPKRYYSVMLCDGNTYNFGYIGTRATGSEAGDYMVVGPDWKGDTPAGIKKVFRSSTQFSLAGYRTQLFGPDDLDNVKKVQAGYKVQTLSIYLRQTPPAAAPAGRPRAAPRRRRPPSPRRHAGTDGDRDGTARGRGACRHWSTARRRHNAVPARHITGGGAIAAAFGSIGPRIFLVIADSTNVHSIDVTM